MLKINSHIKNFFVLFPFILVFIGAIFLNSNRPLGTIFKMSAFFYMILFVLINRSVPKNLLIAFSLFLPFFVYGFIYSFKLQAGIEDGIRYLFPIVVLFYSYSIKEYLPVLIKFTILFVILNFLVQIFNYILWFKGVTLWYFIERNGRAFPPLTMNFLRGTGFVSSFAFYGFMNMVSFLLIYKYYFGKYKKVILTITLLGIISSLSYKTFITVAILLIIYFYKKLGQIILSGFLVLILVFMFKPQIIHKVVDDFTFRVKHYKLGAKSARSDSYRVMFEQISKPNLLGIGVGNFGGPASTKYNSPYYDKLGYSWNGMEWANLATTDTYYPHLFVELGIIGGLLYLMTLLSPFFTRKIPYIVLILYFVLLLDSLMTFSLNNLEFLLYSLAWVYPIIYLSNKEKKLKNETRLSTG